MKEYMKRANAIIGDRTHAEERYDGEVVRGLRKGHNIKEAIQLANKKYPGEALTIDATNIQYVASHYEFLLQHEKITRGDRHAPKRQGP